MSFIRYVTFALFLLVSLSASANSLFIKDWRLEKPFVHGFLVGATFGYVDAKPKNWKVAPANTPSGTPVGMVPFIEQHKVIPFWIGVTVGAFVWVFFISTFVYRYMHREAIARYQFEINLQKDDKYREELSANA